MVYFLSILIILNGLHGFDCDADNHVWLGVCLPPNLGRNDFSSIFYQNGGMKSSRVQTERLYSWMTELQAFNLRQLGCNWLYYRLDIVPPWLFYFVFYASETRGAGLTDLLLSHKAALTDSSTLSVWDWETDGSCIYGSFLQSMCRFTAFKSTAWGHICHGWNITMV